MYEGGVKMNLNKIPKRKANIIINSLQGGVVPRVGLGYIAVGRLKEIDALLKDIEVIEDGGSTFRLICGDYGSGKTFLLQTVKEHLINKNFVVMDCDLSPERSLIGVQGNAKGLATYRKLISNLSTKINPEGGGLQPILDKFIDKVRNDVQSENPGLTEFKINDYSKNMIYQLLFSVNNMVHGIDFINIILKYYDAYQTHNYSEKNKVLKWIRGEYRLVSEVKRELDVSNMINDQNWFDYIEIFSEFIQILEYKGLFVMIDELVNLYRIANSKYRLKNYEKMLNIYNDTLQGRARKMGVIFAGTKNSVYDCDCGIFSYEALKSRLYSVSITGYVSNLLSPIIELTPLPQSDIVILLQRLSEIHSIVYNYEPTIKIEDIMEYLKMTYRMSNPNITTRSIIRDYLNLLNLKMESDDITFSQLVSKVEMTDDKENLSYIVD